MERTFVGALQALPEYSGWQEDEIKNDISSLFSQNDPGKISKFTTALSTSLPEFNGWAPEEVSSNIKKLLGLQADVTPPVKPTDELVQATLGIENPPELGAGSPAAPAAAPSWRDIPASPDMPAPKSNLPPPPEPKLGIKLEAQPPAPPMLEQPFVEREVPPARLESHAKTRLSEGGEQDFRIWYANYSKANNLGPNPDDPRHFYDYRGFWLKNQPPPEYKGEPTEHGDRRLPDEFKLPGHPVPPEDGKETPALLDQPSQEDAQAAIDKRVNRPGLVAQVAADVKSGVNNAKSMGLALIALGFDLEGDPVANDRAMTAYFEQVEKNKEYEPVIGMWKNVENFGDAGRYAIEKLGQNIVMFVPGGVSGAAGGLLAKRFAQRAVAQMIEGQIVKNVSREVAERGAARYVAKRVAQGAAAGAAPASVGMEAGSIYGETAEETGQGDAKKALLYGTAAGVPDVIPTVMAVKRVFGPQIQKAVVDGVVKRLGKAGAAQLFGESSTEAIQTYIEEAAKAKAAGRELHTAQLIDILIESALAGGISGAGIGIATQAIGEAISDTRGGGTKKVKTPTAEEVDSEVMRQAMIRDLEKRKAETAEPAKPKAVAELMPPVVPETEQAAPPPVPAPKPEPKPVEAPPQPPAAEPAKAPEPIPAPAPEPAEPPKVAVEAPKKVEEAPPAAPAPVPPPAAPPVQPAPPPKAEPEAPKAPIPPVQPDRAPVKGLFRKVKKPEGTAKNANFEKAKGFGYRPDRAPVKGLFRKAKKPEGTAKNANFEKAKGFGYRNRTPGEEMAVADIKNLAEGSKFNKIATDVEKAFANRDLWDPEHLGKTYKAWETAEFSKKIDDSEVNRKAKAINASLERDGYNAYGNPVAASNIEQQNLRDEASANLRAQGKVSSHEWSRPATWEGLYPQEKEDLIRQNTYTATEYQEEMDRIRDIRAADQIKISKRNEETVAEASLGGLSPKMNEMAAERAETLKPEDIERAQLKAKRRRAKLRKEYGVARGKEGDVEAEDVSADEMNALLRKAKYPGSDVFNYYESKREGKPGEGPTAEKAPQVVQEEWDKTLDDYFGDNRPTTVNVELSKTKGNGSAWAENDMGEIEMRKDGTATVRVRADLPAADLRRTIVHEVVGHFSLPEIISSDKNIFNIILREYDKDKAAYRAGKSDPRTSVFETYKEDYDANLEAEGLHYAEKEMLYEWLSRQVEQFDAREFTPTNRKVVSLLKAAIKRLLTKLGITDFQEQTIDDAIRASVKKMGERKAPPAPPKEPGSDVVSYQEPKGPGEGGIEFAMPDESRMDAARRKISDFMQRQLRVQEAITGKKGGEMDEAFDVILKNEVMPGRIKTAISDFSKNYLQPLLDAISATGMNLREVQMYLYARHAKERNAQMAKVNPKFNEDIVFNGVRQKNPGSGMPDSLADDIMRYFYDKYRGKIAALENVAHQVRRVNTFHESFLIHNGLVKPEIVNAWRSAYRDYIPLKGFQEEALIAKGMSKAEIAALQEQYYGSGGGRIKGISAAYKSKRATGRSTLANVDEILPNLILQAERDILVAGKSEVGKAFLKMARTYKNNDMWQIVETLPKVQQFNERAGRVIETVDPSFRNRDDILFVMENGEEHAIKIIDEPLRRALKSLYATNGDSIPDKLFRAFSYFNRYLGATITRFSPRFVARNLVRDVQEAMININSEESTKMAFETAKNVLPAIRGMWQYTRDGKASEWHTTAEEASRAGMTVEFLDFNDVESVQRRFEKDLKSMQPNSMQSVRKYLLLAKDFVEDGNTAVENGTRLAFYKTLRDRGFSPARAAQKAKNLTVNFNRKGEWGTAINSAYIFANAAIQGNRRMLQVLRTGKGRAAVVALTVAGFAAAERNRQMGGEDNYKKYDKYTRMKNWMWIFPDGTAITIPVPYNFGIFYGMGVLMNDFFHKDLTAPEAVLATISNVWNSFNPLGDGDLGQTLAPTAVRSFVDIAKNKTYSGIPIYPEGQKGVGDYKPESEKYFKGVSEPSKWISRKVNAAFGGGPYKKSTDLTDISPEVLDYTAKAYAGGVGEFVLKTISSITKIARGELPTLREIPFETFVRKPYESADKGIFYSAIEDLEGVNAEYQDLLLTDKTKAKEFQEEHRKELSAFNISSYKRGQISNYNSQIKIAEKKGNMARVKELEQKTIQAIKEWEKGMDKYGIKIPAK